MTTLNVQESLFGKLPISGASCPYIERLKCHLLISIQTLYYFSHSSPYKHFYYTWVTCDYISRKISPRNWFQCFPVYPRCRSGSGSGSVSVSVSGSISGFRISGFSIRPSMSCLPGIRKSNEHCSKVVSVVGERIR